MWQITFYNTRDYLDYQDFLVQNWHILKAIKKGKEIETYNPINRKWGEFSFSDFYRDSPIRVKPKNYVPFDCMDAKYFLGKKVVKHPFKKESIVTNYDRYFVFIDGDAISYDYFFTHYIFPDLTPCGKKEKQ